MITESLQKIKGTAICVLISDLAVLFYLCYFATLILETFLCPSLFVSPFLVLDALFQQKIGDGFNISTITDKK